MSVSVNNITLSVIIIVTSVFFLSCSTTPTKEEKTEVIYQTGVASWYGKRFHGRLTASGEKYNMHEMTAAHKKLPFGAKVKVIDESTGRFVIVRINDRGPFIKGRVIDLSKKAAAILGIIHRGHAKVRLILLKQN